MDESNRIPPDLAAFAETADENWPYFSIRLIYRDEDGDQVYEHIAATSSTSPTLIISLMSPPGSPR